MTDNINAGMTDEPNWELQAALERDEFIDTWEPYFASLEKRRQANLDFFDPHWRIRMSRFKPWRKNFWRYWFVKEYRNGGHQWTDEELKEIRNQYDKAV